MSATGLPGYSGRTANFTTDGGEFSHPVRCLKGGLLIESCIQLYRSLTTDVAGNFHHGIDVIFRHTLGTQALDLTQSHVGVFCRYTCR